MRFLIGISGQKRCTDSREEKMEINKKNKKKNEILKVGVDPSYFLHLETISKKARQGIVVSTGTKADRRNLNFQSQLSQLDFEDSNEIEYVKQNNIKDKIRINEKESGEKGNLRCNVKNKDVENGETNYLVNDSRSKSDKDNKKASYENGSFFASPGSGRNIAPAYQEIGS